MRLDHHGRFGNHYSPRLYLVHHPVPARTVRGGVENLTRKGPTADGVVDYYVAGRRFFAGVTSRF